MTPFQGALLAWFDRERRDLPWRRTRDPYAIWISEAMLQQTTVAAVIPYYERWMARFPDVATLAAASEEDVLSLWQGLGYYRRARNLHAAAKGMAAVPGDHAGWRLVPGVGPYTAGAIASIALGEAVPLVDGNVERVYARLALDDGEGAVRHRRAWTWADENLQRERPGDWNQALMELGATICRPVNPACLLCPVNEFCAAFAAGRQNEVPGLKARPKPTELSWRAVVPIHDGRVGLEPIPAGEWWEGMWRVPTFREAPTAELTAGEPIGVVRATVTRYRIDIAVDRLELETPLDSLRWTVAGERELLPIPAPQRRILKLAGV